MYPKRLRSACTSAQIVHTLCWVHSGLQNILDSSVGQQGVYLEFYIPVNNVKVMLSQSVILSNTLFLGRVSSLRGQPVHIFASN